MLVHRGIQILDHKGAQGVTVLCPTILRIVITHFGNTERFLFQMFSLLPAFLK